MRAACSAGVASRQRFAEEGCGGEALASRRGAGIDSHACHPVPLRRVACQSPSASNGSYSIQRAVTPPLERQTHTTYHAYRVPDTKMFIGLSRGTGREAQKRRRRVSGAKYSRAI